MKPSIIPTIARCLCLLFLLACLPLAAQAQEELRIAPLFEKYGKQKDVTRVELNGSLLEAYRMTTYRSLVFKDIGPYREEIQQCLDHDKQTQVRKAQEVTEGGVLRSAYYQLPEVERKGEKLHRYIIFKVGKEEAGTLIYIEGALEEKELMQMLYKR